MSQRQMLEQLRVGDALRVMEACFGEDDHHKQVWTEAGETARVYLLDNYGSDQGRVVGVVFDNGVTAVFDELDQPAFPFEPLT